MGRRGIGEGKEGVRKGREEGGKGKEKRKGGEGEFASLALGDRRPCLLVSEGITRCYFDA